VLGIFVVVAAIATLVFYIRRLRQSRKLHKGVTPLYNRMGPGGTLDVDNFPRASPRVHFHYRGPSGSDNYYASGTVVDYGQLQPNRGNMGEVPAMRQMQSNERFRTLPNQGNREEVRAMRQMEISRRLRAAQREMNQLTAAQGAQPASDRVPTPGPSRQSREMASFRDQVRELQNRIRMRNQQQSDWALGLSDDPPPAYG
jgi:hypothetical protein